LAGLGHNHLAALVVNRIHSDCHVMMRIEESMLREKLPTLMPCPCPFRISQPVGHGPWKNF